MLKLDTGYGNNVSTIADLPQVYIETGTFDHDTGDTITLPVAVDAINEYSVEITATTGAGTDPELIWVEKGTTNFVVKCNGNNTTDTFDATIYYIGDIASYGGSIYRRWYVSPDAGIADHGDTAETGSFAWVLDQIGATLSTVELPGNKTYTITTATAVPSNVNIIPQKGAVFGGAGTLTFDNPDQIAAQQKQVIFGSSITVVFTNSGTAHAGWLDTTDIGDNINTLWGWGAKKVILPAGSFSYATTIEVPPDNYQRTLIGQGVDATTITYSGSANAMECVGTATGTRAHVVMEDFKLVGQVLATNGLKIDLGTRKVDISRLFITGFTHVSAKGLYIDSAQGDGWTNIMSISDCIISGNTFGLYADNANIFNVYGGVIESNVTNNLYIVDCRNPQFFGVTIQGCTTGTIANRVIASGRDGRGPSFFGCWFEEPTSLTCLKIEATASWNLILVNFYGCEITSQITSGSDSYAVYLDDSAGAKVSKALFSGCYIRATNAGAGDGTGIYTDGANCTAWVEAVTYSCDIDSAGAGTVTIDS